MKLAIQKHVGFLLLAILGPQHLSTSASQALVSVPSQAPSVSLGLLKLCTALHDQAAYSVKLERGFHDNPETTETITDAMLPYDIEGEDSEGSFDSEPVEEAAPPDVWPLRSANVTNFYRRLEERDQRRHTRYASDWKMSENTQGVVKSVTLISPKDKGDHYDAGIEVWGKPWIFQNTQLQCHFGIVLKLRGQAAVLVTESVIEGLDSDEYRCSFGVSVEDAADFRGNFGVIQDCVKAPLRVTDRARATCVNMTLQFAEHAISIGQAGRVWCSGCGMRWLSSGSVFGIDHPPDESGIEATLLSGSLLNFRWCYGLSVMLYGSDKRHDFSCLRVEEKSNDFKPLHWAQNGLWFLDPSSAMLVAYQPIGLRRSYVWTQNPDLVSCRCEKRPWMKILPMEYSRRQLKIGTRTKPRATQLFGEDDSGHSNWWLRRRRYGLETWQHSVWGKVLFIREVVVGKMDEEDMRVYRKQQYPYEDTNSGEASVEDSDSFLEQVLQRAGREGEAIDLDLGAKFENPYDWNQPLWEEELREAVEDQRELQPSSYLSGLDVRNVSKVWVRNTRSVGDAIPQKSYDSELDLRIFNPLYYKYRDDCQEYPSDSDSIEQAADTGWDEWTPADVSSSDSALHSGHDIPMIQS